MYSSSGTRGIMIFIMSEIVNKIENFIGIITFITFYNLKSFLFS